MLAQPAVAEAVAPLPTPPPPVPAAVPGDAGRTGSARRRRRVR